ncbi:MAG: nuclear transport factor 2 family protein [Bryobacteraceae bacterium]
MSELPSQENPAATILALERSAMDRWGNGDLGGFLEISDPAVTYFDPFQERRVDGLEELTRYYESLRGQVHIDRYEFLDPKVQVCGELAVLTYDFESWNQGAPARWHSTEVYRRTERGWRIMHSHWSLPRKG